MTSPLLDSLQAINANWKVKNIASRFPSYMWPNGKKDALTWGEAIIGPLLELSRRDIKVIAVVVEVSRNLTCRLRQGPGNIGDKSPGMIPKDFETLLKRFEDEKKDGDSAMNEAPLESEDSSEDENSDDHLSTAETCSPSPTNTVRSLVHQMEDVLPQHRTLKWGDDSASSDTLTSPARNTRTEASQVQDSLVDGVSVLGIHGQTTLGRINSEGQAPQHAHLHPRVPYPHFPVPKVLGKRRRANVEDNEDARPCKRRRGNNNTPENEETGPKIEQQEQDVLLESPLNFPVLDIDPTAKRT
ncbi:hypothetical protein BDW02DRAFT_581909 [Decorospora gaudefroyi]|uniref:Uncharacterized protein n=1 Tax=Decorospora gaudefroyi TaxID=184978 RepID=A0A6A5K9E4_9PLEO|nr:hypothetical protein BDW02DRAFT_581909 [Decorospora gaudefroyi]